MGIGLVMFGKGLVMGLLAVFGAVWATYRQRRSERGLPLKQNRNGVFVVSDWAAKVENAARWLWDAVLITTGLWFALLLAICVFEGREGLRAFYLWLLF